LPGLDRLLELKPDSSLVDLGCGQGILARSITPIANYLGIDNSSLLIEEARKLNQNLNYLFQVKNVAKPILAATPTFTHATIVLALQNMADAQVALQNAAAYLQPGGKLVIVLNHPCFRIPRQSGWGIDESTKQQYRWVNRYRSPLKIPINMHPGQKDDNVTWSFHFSLHDYTQMLIKAGFVITNLEEWTSDKESVGKAAKMENRSRSEFPLFLTLVCEKR
jgi:ubiquinone/menaquinone biosynthesis C-methylase UbiE